MLWNSRQYQQHHHCTLKCRIYFQTWEYVVIVKDLASYPPCYMVFFAVYAVPIIYSYPWIILWKHGDKDDVFLGNKHIWHMDQMETSSLVLEYVWIHSQCSRLGAGRSVQWSVKLVLLWWWRDTMASWGQEMWPDCLHWAGAAETLDTAGAYQSICPVGQRNSK